MGLFLDNAVSTKDAPNENLGRELLELHTVGVDAGYTEDDVKASSRMLTGYRVDVWWPRFRDLLRPGRARDGRGQGARASGTPTPTADGRAATTAYLAYLARHPATARRIARRLCVRFVSDDPSAGLVASGGPRLHRPAAPPSGRRCCAMVDHPEFAASAGAKVRTPDRGLRRHRARAAASG